MIGAFFCFFSLPAQKDMSPGSVKSYFWGNGDPASQANEIPANWEKESAVILFQEYNFRFRNSRKNVKQVQAFRRRIKLQDKAAIDQYSEFSYTDKFEVRTFWDRNASQTFAGFKIIKSDGLEKEVDINSAVEIEGSADYHKKIAIPGLEVGDIIDYYFYSYDESFYGYEHSFEPVFTPLSGEYPVKEQRIIFEVEKKFFVAFNSYHGAPELELVSGEKDKFNKYILMDKDREKIGSQRWFYPMRVLPIIKFQVTFTPNAAARNKYKARLGPGETVRKKIAKYEIRDAFSQMFATWNKDYKLDGYLLKKKLDVDNDMRKTLEEAFNYIRTMEYVSIKEKYAINEIDGLRTADEYSLSTRGGGDYISFCKRYARFLSRKGINFDLLIGVPRHAGNINEILFYQELFFMLYIPELEMYVAPVDEYATLSYYPAFIEDCSVYSLRRTATERFWPAKMEDHKVEMSSHEDNTSFQKIEISIGEDLNSFSVQRSNKSWGHLKKAEQDNLLILSDIIKNDYADINRKEYLEKDEPKSKYVKKLISQAKIRYQAKIEEKEKAQTERAKKVLENELDIEIADYHEFEISSMGRSSYESPFSYQESFDIKEEFIQKAGPNLILDIGRFIGGQIGLEKDELEREQDVYLDYARNFDNEIILTIPEGYKVVGLEKLAYEVENETGGFVGKGEVIGTKLVIKTKKYYKANFAKATDWPLMVEFLEAAYKFSQAKILLKKAS